MDNNNKKESAEEASSPQAPKEHEGPLLAQAKTDMVPP